MLRVAVVGSGPAGVYAADALVRGGEVSVDVFDRLPCPYGLVRYGVAPDHLKMKQIALALQKILTQPGVRFLGNVRFGVDFPLAEAKRFYDAVILAYGAAVDRSMDIPGEDLPGSFSATDFVAWYSGHPDAAIDQFTLDAKSVVVIGVGNVAVDVTRVLAKSSAELRTTDVPTHVLDVLGRSAVEDIYMVGRRGPAQAKFTTKELRELGELENADVVVDPAELALDEASEATVGSDATVRRNLDALREWSTRSPRGRPRRLHVRFLLRPAEILGADTVEAVRLERTALDGRGGVSGTGEFIDIPAQMVLRSVGYRGLPLPDLPFDERAGVIPNDGGRVLRDGVRASGEYVAGWIKRGPTGVIGTNKSDAQETVNAVFADHAAGELPTAEERDPAAVVEALAARGVHVVTWQGWECIEQAELALGKEQGRPRTKIASMAELLAAAQGPG